ncbi:16S rRNA pseudouridine(516) synthase RsuA [Shewanella rhizosphaerae]|uniref:16S rRNA pseudouridine(516) synthase RsuA n=1 Tax=Shewanella rhizosphaerae TaxID=2864207 RepID=UPI001C65E1C4|nr:16S rRNA pseudouridine(516) synthase RsuA [Shewanella rhizosphaerae]QYK12122.1 16S rRNA pseudouridine(516) synthase RsuA [Shewanella rhizosphaerae]
MRLDKFISESTQLTRSLAKKALHRGEVTVDGQVIKDGSFKLNENQKVCLDGEPISLIGPRFIMLHKPVDTLCSTVDEVYPSVLNLLELPHKEELHIAGRLDADTTGLVLITSDGQWSHRVTSPKRECGKTYLVQLADPLKAEWVKQFATGLALRSEEGLTKPATLELLGSHEARLTITEGKYHQVKRMFAAVGNKVVGLHRESVGEIVLDESLAPGEWRYLTEAEIASVK